jgi:hypothetical protein
VKTEFWVAMSEATQWTVRGQPSRPLQIPWPLAPLFGSLEAKSFWKHGWRNGGLLARERGWISVGLLTPSPPMSWPIGCPTVGSKSSSNTPAMVRAVADLAKEEVVRP